MSRAFVRPCLGCNRCPVGAFELGLCASCRSRLLAAPTRHCLSCGRPGPSSAVASAWRCPACSRRADPGSEIAWAWSYQPPIDRVLRAFKFNGLQPLGVELGGALWWAKGWAVSRAMSGVDWVAPVPTTWWREARRGYNPAEEIARPIAAALAVPMLELRRAAWGRAQRSLDRRRRLVNLRGAFRLPPDCDLGGAHVLVVDDVVTTGATFEALAALLRSAGAARIVGLAACRTPAPDEPRGGPPPR